MHSPQDTHDELPMGRFRSNAMPAFEALAAPSQHVVLANFVAAANAAVAQNAGFVIDRDHQREFVLAARREPRARSAAGEMPSRRGLRFELAIGRLALPRARAGMVRHQQLDERAPAPASPCRSWWKPSSRFRRDARRRLPARVRRHRPRTRGTRPPAFRSADGTSVGIAMPFMRAASNTVVPSGTVTAQAVDGELNRLMLHLRASDRRLPDSDAPERAPPAPRENVSAPK